MRQIFSWSMYRRRARFLNSGNGSFLPKSCNFLPAPWVSHARGGNARKPSKKTARKIDPFETGNMKFGTLLRGALALTFAGAVQIHGALDAKIDEALPKNAAGNVTREFFSALNSNSPEEIERFVKTKVGSAPWGKMTPEKCERMLKKLQEQSGGLELSRVANSDERGVRMLVKSKQRDKTFGMEVNIDPAAPEKASAVWIHHFPARPEPLPPAPADASERIAAVSKWLEKAAEQGRISMAVIVAKGDEIEINKAWGLANSAMKTPITTDSRFTTASAGKMFTSVAIGQLVQAGKLKYTDTIAAHLPDYPNKEAAAKVTIHHLLTHSGGLGDPFDSPLMKQSASFKTQSDYFPTFANKPLAFAPGERHDYSNGGYIVLAAIVEKLSGQLFADYVRENIFKPAGMVATGITPGADNTMVAAGHTVDLIADPLGLTGPQPEEGAKLENGVGMGGWTSTTGDLFKFARALRSGKLLKKELVEESAAGKFMVFEPMKVKYGYGFYEIPMHKDRLVGHSGGGPDFGSASEVEMLWDADYTIVVLGNHGLEQVRGIAHSIGRFLAQPAPEEHKTASK